MAELLTRNAVEDEFRTRLARLFGKAKQQAMSYILSGREIPPGFWADLQKQSDAEIATLSVLLFFDSAEQHASSVSAPVSRDQLQANASLYAQSRLGELGGSIVTNTRNSLDGAIERLRRRGGADPGTTSSRWDITPADLEDELNGAFGAGRAEAIADTEANRAMIAGGENVITVAGLKVIRYWAHSQYRPRGHSRASREPCPTCTPLEGLPDSEWLGLFPGDVHPRCDCYVEYRDSETNQIIGQG